jgi:hypothetical protein
MADNFENVPLNKQAEVRRMNPSLNSTLLDSHHKTPDGRRIFYKEDGTPFVFDSKGRMITRFKGAKSKHYVKSMRMPKPKTEIGFKNLNSTPMSHVINALDANGNVLHQMTFNTELFDIINAKSLPMTEDAQKEIRRGAMDYMLANRILDAHDELRKLNMRKSLHSLEVQTKIHDDITVATHVVKGSTVTPLKAVKPSAYTVPTVFDPMGMSWSPFDLKDAYTNPIMARHHRKTTGKDFLSLHGLGFNKYGEFDMDAVNALFGEHIKGADNNWRYSVTSNSINFSRDSVIGFKEGVIANQSLTQHLNTMTLKEQEQYLVEVASQKVRDERRKKWEEKQLRKRKIVSNDPVAYVMGQDSARQEDFKGSNHIPTDARIIENLNRFNDLFVESTGGKITTGITWDPSKLHNLYISGDDVQTKYGPTNFSMTEADFKYIEEQGWGIDSQERKDYILNKTMKQLELLGNADPKAYNELLESSVLDDKGKFADWKYAKATTDYAPLSPEERAKDERLNAERRAFNESTAGRDDDEWTRRRLHMTTDILDNKDGYESYQYAREVIKNEDMQKVMGQRDYMGRDEMGYYQTNEGRKDYYTRTYDRHGNEVFALLDKDLSKNVYIQNLENGETRAFDVLTAEELQGKMYGAKGDMRNGYDLTQRTSVGEISSEAIKDNFVLTSYGEQKAMEAQKNMSKLTYHTFVIDKLLANLNEAKESGNKEQIKLDAVVKEAFGLKTDTVGSLRAFASFQDYMTGAKTSGITNQQLFDFQMTGGRAFDNLLSAAYNAKSETYSGPVKKEFFRWKNARDNLRAERTELTHSVNLDTQSEMMSDLTTNEEAGRQATLTRHDKELHEYSTRLTYEQEEADRAMNNIKNAVDKLGHSNEQAKKKIMNAIQQSMFDSQPLIEKGEMTQAEYDAKVRALLEEGGNIYSGADNEQFTHRLKYDNILEEVNNRRMSLNEGRVAAGLEPYEKLDSLIPVQQVKVQADEESIKKWTNIQDNMDKTDQLYRLSGDMTLYDIKSVNQKDGTVIAERMALPAKAFDVQIKMLEDLDSAKMSEALDKANKEFFTKEVDDHLQLTQKQWDEIGRARSVFVQQFKENQSVVKAHLKNEAMYSELLQESIGMSRATENGRNFNLARVNNELLDVVFARAGWMVKKGQEDILASNINYAMMLAIDEQANSGNPLNLGKGDKYFDQDFEDRFVKSLHKVHFDMSDRKTSAADQLILDVARLAGQYVDDINGEDYQLRITAETNRLLQDKAGDIISKEFTYYNDALKEGNVSRVITENIDDIKVASMEKFFALEDRNSGTRPDVDYNADDIETFEIDKQRERVAGLIEAFGEDIDPYGPAADDLLAESKGARDKMVFIDGDAGDVIRNMNSAYDDMREIQNAKDIGELKGKKFSAAREIFGNAIVEGSLHKVRKGTPVDLPTAFEALDTVFNKKLVPEMGREAAYGVIQEIFGRGVGNEGEFFAQALKEMRNPTINTVDRLASYVDLGEAIPELGVKVTVNSDELRRLNPDAADMVPDNEEFTVFRGKQGDLLARANSVNKVFSVANTTQTLGEDEKMVRQFAAWNTSSEDPDWNARVKKTWMQDGGTVEAPDGHFPVEVNTPYNSNRVTRHPGGGFTNSSDIATREYTNQVRNGASFVGLDFETTGFLGDKYLADRGLVLPTELYMEEGKVGANGYEKVGSKHVFMDVGAQVDKNGMSVRDIVSNELGGMNTNQFIQEKTGTYGPVSWNHLTDDERAKVMGSSEVSFLRNIAKYSNEATDSERANLIAHTANVPNNFDNAFKDLVRHATIGLDQLSKGAGIEGAVITDNLKDFMTEYKNMTDDKILLMQNGANADLEWAKDFAKRSGDVVQGHQFFNGVQIDEQPKMIEMMHLSRLNSPSESKHDLASQIERGSMDEGVKDAYRKGSHLANNDTIAMNQLFASDYINKRTDDSVQWMKPGDTLVKLGSRGGNKIPHDVYSVMNNLDDGMFNKDSGMFELHLGMQQQDGDVRIETVSAPSLQELQRNISQNYKGFSNEADAQKFLQDLTMDDAREDISRANLSYDGMIRERNRAQGNGVDVGLQKLKERYDTLQSTQGPDFGQQRGDLSPMDKKVLSNANLLDNYDEFAEPDYSDRQVRAMQQTGDYFKSEDADMRMKFLGDIHDLQEANVINQEEGRNLIAQYNERIKQKAAAAGAGYEKMTVPGLVDLGTVQGDKYRSLSGTPLTVMANTYEQAEQGLWNIAEKFKGTVDPALHQGERYKGQAISNMIGFFKEQGIMGADAGNRMEDAVNAVMNHLEQNGPAQVDDLSKPLIQGANADAVRQIFEDTHTDTVTEAYERFEGRPDLQQRYLETKQMRGMMEQEGLATSKMNFSMPGSYEGQHLPLEGDFALRHAKDIYSEIQSGPSAERNAELWKEMFHRAQGEYSDASIAQSYLGWDSTPDNYVHPFDAADGKYAAGTRYADMDWNRGPRGQANTVENISNFSPYEELQARAGEYFNGVRDGSVPHPLNPPEPPMPPTLQRDPLADADDAARQAIKGNGYTDEWDWNRPESGNNRAISEIEQGIHNTNARVREMAKGVLEAIPGGGRTVGLVAAGLGAAFVARQWTRGDLGLEERPEHNQSSGTGGDYQGDGAARETASSAAHTGPAPSGGKTYLTGDQGGVAVQVNAKNNGNVSKDQIDQALNSAMSGHNATLSVQHQDDTSSINSEWLQSKFSELLGRGYVN